MQVSPKQWMIFYIFNICNKSSFTCSHKEQQGKVLSGLHCREKKKKKKEKWMASGLGETVCVWSEVGWSCPEVGGRGLGQTRKPQTFHLVFFTPYSQTEWRFCGCMETDAYAAEFGSKWLDGCQRHTVWGAQTNPLQNYKCTLHLSCVINLTAGQSIADSEWSCKC